MVNVSVTSVIVVLLMHKMHKFESLDCHYLKQLNKFQLVM